MTDALVRLEGFAGLRDGLTVIRGLVERYWDGLFPEPDDDGLETKVGPVAGLSGSGAPGTLSQPIRTLPITRGSSARYSLWHYEQAADLEKLTDPVRRDARTKAGVVTMEQFRQSVKESPAEQMQEIFATVEQSRAALAGMAQAFGNVAGNEAPATSALRDLLDKVAGAIRFVAADKLAVAAQVVDSAVAVVGEAGPAGEATHSEGVVVVVRRLEGFASRDEALAELTKIAAYFRKTEPHSPLSYTIDEAVRRGRLTLPQLLAELAQDPAHIKHILLAAGIKELPAS
jgi:type VI secretion system protein ImpA